MKDLTSNSFLQTEDGREIQEDVTRCTGSTFKCSSRTCRRLLFCTLKYIHAHFNGMQWTADENWTVKCTVLMELLQKNTFITDINLWGQGVR